MLAQNKKNTPLPSPLNQYIYIFIYTHTHDWCCLAARADLLVSLSSFVCVRECFECNLFVCNLFVCVSFVFNSETVEVLLKAGANPNLGDDMHMIPL